LSARPTDVDIETARTVDLEAHGLLIEGQPQSGKPVYRLGAIGGEIDRFRSWTNSRKGP